MVRTSDVRGALAGRLQGDPNAFVLIDALGCSRSHPTLPGSICLEPNNAETLRENYDVQRNIIIFCQSGGCPESYKLAASAVSFGFQHIYWYRGGIMAWSAEKLPLIQSVAPNDQ